MPTILKCSSTAEWFCPSRDRRKRGDRGRYRLLRLLFLVAEVKEVLSKEISVVFDLDRVADAGIDPIFAKALVDAGADVAVW